MVRSPMRISVPGFVTHQQAAAGLGYSLDSGDVVGLWRYLRYNLKSDQPVRDLSFNGPMTGVTFRW